jgi:BclB C-terminal domain-containing protein
MNSNNFINHGCSGCGGGGGSRHGNSGCFRKDTGQINCNVGPFTAIDAACIPPTVNTGSIIAFSSGIVPAVLTSVAGLVGTSSQIGFGTSFANIVILGNGTIDLSLLPNEAFTVPRTGNLTAISATFTATAAVILGATATIHAQIYRAPVGSSVFSPTNATVDLAPPLPSPIAIGNLSFGSATFAPIPVAVGDRLVMVFSVTAPGLVGTAAVTGTASAGITIS